MPTFSTRRRLPYSARQMYELVGDVERYPEFLPLCEGLAVHARQPTADGGMILTATMWVGYKAIREKFTTRVVLNPTELAIDVQYLDGPFSHLENTWRFVDLPDGSETRFDIDYEFRSRLLAIVMGAMFDQAFRKFADAFEARARSVYGASAASPA